MANYTVPPVIGTLRLNNGRVATFYESQRDQYERSLAAGATPVEPPPADTTVVDGKEVSTTANVPPPADTVTTSESQATPQPATPPTQPGPTTANEDAPTQAPTQGGVGAGTSSNAFNSRGSDDNPGASSNSTQQAINTAFASQIITPQPNVLDQYASYTYAISWWLLSPDQFNGLSTAGPLPGTGNWSLLIQSGGAPTAGRNQSFPLDYYLDDLEIETQLAGKGTGMSTNGMSLRFKIVEPNGLTLLQNLFSAVKGVYKNNTPITNVQVNAGDKPSTVNATQNTTQPTAFQSAQYCLTIEFYGYDSQGNLVAPATGNLDGSTAKAVIKKYYPFLIENITFRTVANQVEYTVIGNPVPYDTATSQARGTIPFAFALAGQTVGQILQGGPLVAEKTPVDTQARVTAPRPKTAPVPSLDPFELNDTGFVTNAGGAAFGNPNLTRQGRRSNLTR